MKGRTLRLTLAAAVAIGLGAASALVVPDQALAAPSGAYVAMGDSYTSGPSIPPTIAPVCGRSGANYPSLVRQKLGSTPFNDVSCAGAVIQNVVGGQISAVSASTKLVTVSIGGNDVGFPQIVFGCGVRSVYTAPGAPCATQFGPNGLANMANAAAPRLLSLYKSIKARAPGAKVLVIGYPTVISPTTCPGGFSAGDTPYLAKAFAGINDMIKQQAEAAGVTYVDTASSSVGHGICAPVLDRWVENRTVTHAAAPWHPNEMSMTNTASQIVSVVGSAE